MKKIRIKSLIALVLCFTLLASAGVMAADTDPLDYSDITVTLNGIKVTFDVNPYINDDDRTMVEVREISEALGATVAWDGTTQTVTIERHIDNLKATHEVVIMYLQVNNYILNPLSL